MNSISNITFKLWGWVGIILNLTLALRMGYLLHSPGPSDGETILTLGVMMALEFILAHSGVMMALAPKRLALIILVPAYAIFAWFLSSSVPNNTLIWLYFGVVATRMRFAFSAPSKDATIANAIFSITVGITYFILLMVIGGLSDDLPRYGITEAYLDSIQYKDLTDASGVFVDLPHVPLIMGIIYFTLLAFYEWLFFKKLTKQFQKLNS